MKSPLTLSSWLPTSNWNGRWGHLEWQLGHLEWQVGQRYSHGAAG